MNRRWVIYDGDGRGLTRRDVFWNIFYGLITLAMLVVMAYFIMAAAADEAAAGTTYFILDTPDHARVYVVCQEQGANGPPPVPTDANRKSDGDVIYAYEDMKCNLIVKPLRGLEAAVHGLQEAVGVSPSPSTGGGRGGGGR